MDKKICVYTCITGDYDNLHEIEHPEANIDYYCFTNGKNLKSKTWKIIQLDNPDKLDNIRLARKTKIIGHPKINKYDVALWTDADIVWQKPISEFINIYFKNTSLAIFKHHARNSVYAEAIACLQFRKDSKNNITNILDYYKTNSYPDNNSLYETTVFIKKPHDPQVIKTMNIWFNMVKNYSCRDQLSFTYALWKTRLPINAIQLNVWDNCWFYTVKHNDNTEIKDCHIYFGNSDQDFTFSKYYIYPYRRTEHALQISAVIPNDSSEIEVNLSNAIGASYHNIIFKPNYNFSMTFGAVNYDKQTTFCIGRSIIKYYGNFKKGQKLHLSIDMKILDQQELRTLVEKLWLQNDKLLKLNSTLKEHVDSLSLENSVLNNQLQSILSSKSWRAIQKIRKAVYRK